MKVFYTKVLEMELMAESEHYFTIMAGTTKILFEKDATIPFYHVCFRTKADYYDHMYQKLGLESVLISNEKGQYSMFWKGKQAYFVDPDGNIIEMLERPFNGEEEEGFGWHDVGEIGLPVLTIADMEQELNEILRNEQIDSSETFAFYGDTQGVFVLVKEGRHWYPTERPAICSPIKIVASGDRDATFKHKDYPYEIIVRKEWTASVPAVQFRIARPTNQLEKLIDFYEKGVGLERIGEFWQHEGYDGIMLGLPDSQYHIEFTQSEEIMELPRPTKEHLFVFYVANRFERDKIVNRLACMGYREVEPENPYWGRGGVTIEDPDGWRIVLMNTAGI
jgi:catechol 2,3-dioxygenase-like lactoylglutathione lyase family enzyme